MSHVESSDLPAICAEMKMTHAEGVPVINSRDLAAMFGKEHRNVLRDIVEITEGKGVCSNLSTPPWFRERLDENLQNGQKYRSFDMTRDGFTLVVMGWTGARAMEFKVRYIHAFNAMEAALKGNSYRSELSAVLREAMEPISAHIERLIDEVEQIKLTAFAKRRRLSNMTKADHVDAVEDLGGRCPCCGVSMVVFDGEKSNFAEFDHFYANSRPGPDHTWLICKPCHTDLSTGRVPRDQRETVFKAYQDQRRRLPGRQTGFWN